MVHSPLDYLALTDSKRQWRTAIVTRIELRPITRKRAQIVHIDLVSALRLARAFDGVRVLGLHFGSEGQREHSQKEGQEAHVGDWVKGERWGERMKGSK